MRRFIPSKVAIATLMLLMATMLPVNAKIVWQDTDKTRQDTYLSERRALTGRHCVVNKLINVVGVGSGNAAMSNLTDEDLTNYASFVKVVDATVAVNPIVSVRDMDNHYAAGTQAGFMLQAADGNLLSLNVIKAFSIAFYLEGSLVGTVGVSTGQDVSVLGLSLITIPGSKEAALELSATAPGEFDEIALMPAGGVDATLTTATKIRYAFVGKQREHTLTYDEMATYATSHSRKPFTLYQSAVDLGGDDLIDNNLSNGAAWGVLAIGSGVTATVGAKIDRTDTDHSQPFKAGSIVGFNYTTGSLLKLPVGNGVRIILYKGEWVEKTDVLGNTYWDWEETKVQDQLLDATVLGLTLINGGNSIVTITAAEDFSTARISFPTGLKLDLGGIDVHYAFVCDPAQASHECDIRLSADASICDTETGYQLVKEGSADVTWSITSQPSAANAVVDSYGYLTGMTANGEYIVRATSVDDGVCFAETKITRGLAGSEAACDSPIYNSGVTGAPTYALSNAENITDSDGGTLLAVNSVFVGAENILNPQTGDFATYRGGLKLADNMGIVGVHRTDAYINNASSSPARHRIGFVVEMRSTGLSLSALSMFNIRTYLNGEQTYSSVVAESDVIGLGLIGSERNQKVRLAITVPEDVSFNEFVLWKTGVLDVDIATMKVYYAFDETVAEGESAVLACVDPLGCDSQLISPETTGATLNANETKTISVLEVAHVIDNLSFLIDDDVNTAVSITNTVSLGSGLVLAVDLGRTFDKTHAIGVVIDDKSYLASLNVASWLTIATYKNGVATGDSHSDWSVAGVDVIGYGDKRFLVMHPTRDYDEVRITIAGVLSALDVDTKLYGLYVTSDRDADGIADCRDEDACSDELVLNEDAYVLHKSKDAYSNANLVLHRTLYNDVWNPIVLPVNLTGLQLRNAFGNGVHVAEPKSLQVITSERLYGSTVYDVTSSCIEFAEVTEDVDDEYVIEKGKFYLIKPDADILPDLNAEQTYTSVDESEGVINGPIYFIPGVNYKHENLDITPLTLEAVAPTGGANAAPRRAGEQEPDVVFNGTYVNLDQQLIPEGAWAYHNDGSLWEADDNDERALKGFRFYIENKTENIVTYGFDNGSGLVVTGIEGIKEDLLERTATPGVYTIDGRLLGREIGIDSLPAGIYIVNGKKVLVR